MYNVYATICIIYHIINACLLAGLDYPIGRCPRPPPKGGPLLSIRNNLTSLIKFTKNFSEKGIFQLCQTTLVYKLYILNLIINSELFILSSFQKVCRIRGFFSDCCASEMSHKPLCFYLICHFLLLDSSE